MDSVAICLEHNVGGVTDLLRPGDGGKAARAAENLGPQLPAAQQDKTAGRTGTAPPKLSLSSQGNASIYRRLEAHRLCSHG
jgi:hypothetical protein